jgi:Flp pilus assembly pilin Flp
MCCERRSSTDCAFLSRYLHVSTTKTRVFSSQNPGVSIADHLRAKRADLENPHGRKSRMLSNLIHDEHGASMAEYAMLLALIAVATIAAVSALRDQIVAVFQASASTLGSAK